MIEQTDIIQKVETFIQRIRDLDYVVDTGGNDSDRSSLAASMTVFEMSINESESNRIPYAMLCLLYIDKALAEGIIKEGKGLINKFKDCSEENIKLRQELEITSNNLMRAKEKIEELEQMIPHAGIENS